MSEPEYLLVTFDRLVHETAAAWLLDFGGNEVWIPKSVSDDPSQSLSGTKEIFLQGWFVEQESLEDYAT